jgi:hypothetical protein
MGLCHELSLKIETYPSFQVEIYIIFYNNSHHNDGIYIFENGIFIW